MALFELNLTNLWRIIYKRRWIILCIFLVIFLSTIFFTNRQSPVYLAQATVKVTGQKLIGDFILCEDWGEQLDMDEEVQFIRSRQFREEVVKRLAPASERETLGEPKKLSRGLPRGISAWRVGKLNIIEIRTMASRPEVAAELANTVAKAYVDLNLRKKIRRLRTFRQRIEKQLITLKAKLDDSEQALKDFKEREGNITLEKKRLKGRLVTLELKLSELLQKYPKESPVVKELKGELQATRDQVKGLASKELELERLTRNFEYEQKTYEGWKERAISMRFSEESKIPDVSIIDTASPPQSPVSPNKLLNAFVGALVGLMAGISFTFLIESLQTSLRTIEEVENFTKLPVLGTIPYLPIKEDKEKSWQRLLYKKKRDKLSRLREQLIIHYSPRSPIAESYRSLRTGIQSAALKKGHKLLLVTSTGPGEGKSITCANLALTCAQAGYRVLLVGGDLRRPILYKLFGLKREPGLADCLTGTAKWENVLRTIVDILVETTEWEEILRMPGLDNLKIITCGHLPLNPAELLGSQETKSLVEELKANFDFILFDSPPVLPIADAAILGPRLDGVILVYQTGKVARDALRRAKEQLESVGSSIKGIVLNNTTREMEAYPAYYYHRYKYYGKEKEEEPEIT